MDESRKTTAFTGLYRLVEEGETLLKRGDLDGALAKYRQAAQLAPGGTQMEQQLAQTIQSILRSKQALEASGPTLVQKVPGSTPGVDTQVVVDPYQGQYQPNTLPGAWGSPSTWRNPTYPTPTAPASASYAMPEPAPDAYAYQFDQAMEAINYGDWSRAESLLAGISAAQPSYTRSGITVQDALAHVHNQTRQAAAPSRLKKWGLPALIGGGLALCVLTSAAAAGLFGYTLVAPATPTPTATATPIAVQGPIHTTVTAPVLISTQLATATPLPSATPFPTNTAQPTDAPTQPPPTERPAPTQPPDASCCTLRVRNHAGSPLWIGTNMPYGGNTIKPNWYVEFYLSGPQSVTISYCDVSFDGSLIDCETKSFEVSEPLQEEAVP